MSKNKEELHPMQNSFGLVATKQILLTALSLVMSQYDPETKLAVNCKIITEKVCKNQES